MSSLMILGLNAVSWCDNAHLYLQITRSDIRLHVKWAVSLVIADGLCEEEWSGVCVSMYGLFSVLLLDNMLYHESQRT